MKMYIFIFLFVVSSLPGISSHAEEAEENLKKCREEAKTGDDLARCEELVKVEIPSSSGTSMFTNGARYPGAEKGETPQASPQLQGIFRRLFGIEK
ncbi:hypothetical protein AB1K42_27685 [Roseibium algicola]|uniref:hypothetical protein n=1 Tax=Roseibium algicola TaxID=2857014 RepID=UPI003457C365